MRIGLLSLALAFVVPALAGQAATIDTSRLPAPASRNVDFVKDVQPILSASCYNCHGPKRAEGGLRFDRRSDALRGSDNGPVIVGGKSAESLMVHAVSGLKDDLKMPKKGEPLTADQIGILRAWIDQGATWPDSAAGEKKDHWAFKSPERPPVPAAKTKGWVRTPIDNFILARLEKEKLKPSPEADKTTLLRRLSLDLIGLPPTIPEINEFLADKSDGAYETQIERLLNSPHYGERWGRHWLDAARYADSDGFEKDKPRYIWCYRDYVINAFNRDLPYNQFIIEQLAGDLLPNRTQDQIVATGFLRNSMLNEEGGVDPEQFRMDGMFDRMDAIGKGMLGLTIQCAQCHNHKFDPLTQEEYYRLFAFINNDHESSIVAYTEDEQRLINDLQRQMRDARADLQKRNPDWQDRMAKWEDSVKGNQPEWTVLREIEHIGENDQRYYYLKDGSMLAAGYAPTKWSVVWKTTNKIDSVIGAMRLELFTDENLPAKGPGRSLWGTCALTEFKVDAAEAGNPTNKMSVKIAKATADYGNPERKLEPNFYDKSTNNRVTGPIEFAIDGDGNTAWGIDAGPGRRNTDRKAVFVPEKPIAYSNGAVLTFKLSQNHGGWNSDDLMNNNLGRYRLSFTSATNVTADPIPKTVRDIIENVARDKRTPAQVAAIFDYWHTTVPDWKEANDKIENLWARWPQGANTFTLAARDEPRMTAILRRGDWLKPGKPVTPGVPAFLHSLPPGADDSRLTFAKWVTDRKAPTTARVFVNRMWQAYFGNGIVATPEDFGMQAEAPSHAELLDWLACEFMDSGWSVKHMHRLIANSATYRQSSKVTPELYAKDQYNRLLAHGPRFRVEGEIVRDIALAASGLLNPKMGGRSLMPPAPAFVFQPPASYAPFPWIEETGPEKYRRAIYTWRRRSTPYPPLQAFDVPNADFSCVRRARSDTPLQALTTLNEQLFVESAQALARRVLEQGGKTDPDRLTYAFQLCVARKPSADERSELLAFLDKQRNRFAEGWLEPKKMAEEVPSGATPTQVAAWTAVSRVLLNLDETITKE